MLVNQARMQHAACRDSHRANDAVILTPSSVFHRKGGLDKGKIELNKGIEKGKEELAISLVKGKQKMEEALGLGKKPNVVPPGKPNIKGSYRPVYIGWHPVAGFAGQWFAEKSGLGRYITEKINSYPDPTQHWAVIVGDYVHQLWMVCFYFVFLLFFLVLSDFIQMRCNVIRPNLKKSWEVSG